MFHVDMYMEIINGVLKMIIMNHVNVHFVEQLVHLFRLYLELNKHFMLRQIQIMNQQLHMLFIHVVSLKKTPDIKGHPAPSGLVGV